MKKFLLFVSLLSFLFFSCNILTFEEDTGETKPGLSVSWFNGEYVVFLFSCEVVHYYAEEGVTLKSGSSQYSTDKNWIGNMLFIKPSDGWVKGRMYQSYISGTMYKPSGNTFPVYATSSFTYGDSSSVFCAVSLPPTETECDTDYSFSFAFNKEISKVSFEDSLSISPAAEYRVESSPDKKVFTVYPKNSWSVSTSYSWKITGLKSLDGWEMQYDLTGSFVTKNDYDYPVLEKICPVSDLSDSSIWFEDKVLDGNMSGEMPLGFIFSKSMKFESVKKAVTITPSIDGYFLQADSDGKRFLFVPEKYWKLKKKYIVKVSADAKDKSDLSLFTEFSDSFTSCDEWLELEGLKFDTEEISDWKSSPISHQVSDETISIMLTFSNPFSEDKLYSATNAVSLSLLFPLSSTSPVKTEVLWNEARNVMTVTYKNLTVKTADVPTYYQLKLSGGESGLNTGTGLYLKEDICINIQPE